MRDPTATPALKHQRQQAILELIARTPVASQEELAERLHGLGFAVTQATVSRDVAELGLVKIGRGDRHRYVSPADLPAPPDPFVATDRRLRRLLEDVPVTVVRSGLSLVLRAAPGLASAIAQAIDQSSLEDQVGTLAGDDTLLVLFADEPALMRWLARFAAIQSAGPAEPLPAGPPAPTPPAPTPPVTSEAPR